MSSLPLLERVDFLSTSNVFSSSSSSSYNFITSENAGGTKSERLVFFSSLNNYNHLFLKHQR